MILVDTSGLLASYDRDDRHHAAASKVLARPGQRILSPFVLAELDYLLSQLGGQSAEVAMLEDVARGVYQLASFSATDVAAAGAFITRYADLRLGLADASVAVLAERYGCRDVLTLDQRHFRVVAGPGGQPFRLLPADELAGQ